MRYLTIKEMAELLAVSKPTIQKAIKDLDIEYDRKDTQKLYFSVYKAVGILKYIRFDFDVNKIIGITEEEKEKLEKIQPFTRKEPEETALEDQKTENIETALEEDKTEIPEKETEKPDEETDKKPKETEKPIDNNSKELEIMRSMLQIIEQQLKEKEKQLEIKDKQIDNLNNRLQEALKITHAQQYLTATDKQAQLLDSSPIGEDKETAKTAANNQEVKKKRDLITRIKDFFKD